MDANTLLAALVAAGAGIGAYAAIRADLARLHARVDVAMAAVDKAHSRIDDMHKVAHG